MLLLEEVFIDSGQERGTNLIPLYKQANAVTPQLTRPRDVQSGNYSLMRFVLVIVKVFLWSVAFALLTMITQVGGIALVLSATIFGIVNKHATSPWARSFFKLGVFLVVYLTITLLVVPFIAPRFGRVQLPVMEQNHVKPGNIGISLLNRNYVRPELRDVVFKTASVLHKKYPSAVVNYLDGSFPFFNGFRLLPHRDHSDGRRIDLSFQYNHSSDNALSTDIPSFIGYGICEEPRKNEEDRPKECAMTGYWQYDLLREIVPQGNKKNFVFAESRNRFFLNTLKDNRSVSMILIEPHLKARLSLNSSKIRLHSCRAVRHDDHVHVMLR